MPPLSQEILLPPAEELTAERFWEMWGEESGLEQSQLQELWTETEAEYIDLPYHNFLHARETLWETMRLADLCKANGIVVNRKVLILGALKHDSGYYEDHKQLDYEDKESYSVGLLRRTAAKYGLSKDEVLLTGQAIMATKRGSHTVTLEDKIVRRADLANIAGRYAEDFLYKTRLFHEETELLSGKTINLWDFAAESIKILSEYLDDDLSLGLFDDFKDRQSVFQSRAIANLKQLAFETAKHKGERVTELARRLGSHTMKMLGFDKAA